jgi:hypothetical protein
MKITYSWHRCSDYIWLVSRTRGSFTLKISGCSVQIQVKPDFKKWCQGVEKVRTNIYINIYIWASFISSKIYCFSYLKLYTWTISIRYRVNQIQWDKNVGKKITKQNWINKKYIYIKNTSKVENHETVQIIVTITNSEVVTHCSLFNWLLLD